MNGKGSDTGARLIIAPNASSRDRCYSRAAVAHRVLYLVDSLGTGGAEHGLVLTVRHLDRTRVEPEVAFLWDPARLRAEIEAAGVRVHRIGARPGVRALLGIPRIRRLLRRGRFDAIHTQVLWASITGRIAGRLARVTVISHIANVETGGFRDRELEADTARKARVLARLDAWTGRRFVDRFVAISEAVRAEPIRGAGWDPAAFEVVRRGQELDRLRERAAEPVDPPLERPGSPMILAVGRLAEQKGLRFLLEAMPAVLAANRDARLLVAGEGHLRRSLEQQAAPLGDRVAFLGVRGDVPALVAHADVFVFASLWEGQGNALLEAMAIGAAIVATAIPSTLGTLVHEESAVLVPPADTAALAAAVNRIVAEPELAGRLGAGARVEAERYDIERTTRELEALYDRVIGPPRFPVLPHRQDRRGG
jgi:glycosyltransferase involved in cell wall biosynthesis